jgi:hypothetical protein
VKVPGPSLSIRFAFALVMRTARIRYVILFCSGALVLRISSIAEKLRALVG